MISKAKITALLFAIGLLSLSCIKTTTVDGPPEQLKVDGSSFEGLEIPKGFDWNIFQSVAVTVTPADQYAGQYRYGITIHDIKNCDREEGSSTETAETEAEALALLDRGLTQGDTPYLTTVAVPKSRTHLMIAQISPSADTTYATAPILNGRAEVSFAPQATAKSSAALRNQLHDDEMLIIPSNVINLQQGAIMKAGEIYYIPEGVTVTSPTLASDLTIYVAGTLTFKQQTKELPNQSRVIILPTGSFNGYSLMISEQSKIYNYGTVNIDNELTLASSSELYNYSKKGVYEGRMEAFRYVVKDDAVLYNYSFMDTGFIMNINEGGVVHNYGRIYLPTETNTKLSLGKLGKIIIYEGASTNSFELYLSDGAVISLKKGAIIRTSNKIQASKGATIENDESGYAAIITPKLGMHNRADLTGRIAVDCPMNSIRTSYGTVWDADLLLGGNPGATAVAIAATPYNDGGYNADGAKNPDYELGGDVDILYSEAVYTSVFEDNFPKFGDMDFNDIVINWQIGTQKNDQSQITRLGFKYAVRALGASKHIGAAVVLKNLPGAKGAKMTESISLGETFDTALGLEIGVAETVIPLFEDAAGLFGLTKDEVIANHYINVSHSAPKTFMPYRNEVIVDLSVPASGPITMDNFGLFIVTAVNNKGKRTEIHPFGGKTTTKASIPTDFSLNNKAVWGATFSDEFGYPKEYKSIKNAYPYFESWVKSSGINNVGWYKHPNKQLIY